MTGAQLAAIVTPLWATATRAACRASGYAYCPSCNRRVSLRRAAG